MNAMGQNLLHGWLGWWGKSAVGDYYRGLSARDQRIVQAVAALLVVTLLYVLLWRPLSNWRDDNAARYADSVKLLQWLHDNEAQARQSSTQRAGAAGAGESLLAVVGNVARELGLTLTRFQPEGAGGVSVVLQEEEFDKVLRFVDRLESRHALTVRQFSFDRQSSPGHVTARLVIR